MACSHRHLIIIFDKGFQVFDWRHVTYRIAHGVAQGGEGVVSRQGVEGVVPQVQGILPLELGLVVEHVRIDPRWGGGARTVILNLKFSSCKVVWTTAVWTLEPDCRTFYDKKRIVWTILPVFGWFYVDFQKIFAVKTVLSSNRVGQQSKWSRDAWLSTLMGTAESIPRKLGRNLSITRGSNMLWRPIRTNGAVVGAKNRLSLYINLDLRLS